MSERDIQFTAEYEKANANLYPGEPTTLADEVGVAAGFHDVVVDESRPKRRTRKARA